MFLLVLDDKTLAATQVLTGKLYYDVLFYYLSILELSIPVPYLVIDQVIIIIIIII